MIGKCVPYHEVIKCQVKTKRLWTWIRWSENFGACFDLLIADKGDFFLKAKLAKELVIN